MSSPTVVTGSPETGLSKEEKKDALKTSTTEINLPSTAQTTVTSATMPVPVSGASSSGSTMQDSSISTPAPQPTASPLSDSTAPTTSTGSSALATVPLKLTPNPDGRKPTLQNIKPWDLTTPMPFSSLVPYFYDAATQEYWIFTDLGACMVHKTPRTVIQKKQARKLIRTFPTRAQAVELLSRELNIPKSTTPQVVPDLVVIYNAVQDSVIVERVKESTGLIKFWEDKYIQGQDAIITTYLQYLRPTFDGVKSHKCQTLYHCGNNIIYCTGCTGYHIPASATTTSISYHPPRLMGQVTMPASLARQLLARCLNPGGTTLSVAGAYIVLQHCFNMTTFTDIPIAQDYLIANLLRDSLFVSPDESARAKGALRVSWAMFFGIGGQLLPNENNAANAAAVAKIAGAGVATGLGIASLLLGF